MPRKQYGGALVDFTLELYDNIRQLIETHKFQLDEASTQGQIDEKINEYLDDGNGAYYFELMEKDGNTYKFIRQTEK